MNAWLKDSHAQGEKNTNQCDSEHTECSIWWKWIRFYDVGIVIQLKIGKIIIKVTVFSSKKCPAFFMYFFPSLFSHFYIPGGDVSGISTDL